MTTEELHAEIDCGECDDDEWMDDFPEEHGHVCPCCGLTYYCYEDCPEDTPMKKCVDCLYKVVRK